MKKRLAMMLSLVMVICLLSACGSSEKEETTTAAAETTTAAAETTTAEETTTAAETTTVAETTAAEETTTAEAPEGAVTITDMTGREITLVEPATRVVALSAADCEFLFAIGAGETLVGRGEFCDYPAEVLDIPAVQSGSDTNIEQIIALDPDLLLMSTMAQSEEQVAALENAGITVVVSDAQDIEGIYTALRMIGTLMGKEENAEAVISEIETSLADLKTRADAAKEAKALEENETVYFEVSPLEWGLWAAGGGTFMNEVAELLGLENIFADEPAWAEVSEEQIIERDPDYIVTITMYYGEGDTPEQEIASRAGWENITAVKNNAILRMENNELARPTPRIVDGAEMLFALVYGE